MKEITWIFFISILYKLGTLGQSRGLVSAKPPMKLFNQMQKWSITCRTGIFLYVRVVNLGCNKLKRVVSSTLMGWIMLYIFMEVASYFFFISLFILCSFLNWWSSPPPWPLGFSNLFFPTLLLLVGYALQILSSSVLVHIWLLQPLYYGFSSLGYLLLWMCLFFGPWNWFPFKWSLPYLSVLDIFFSRIHPFDTVSSIIYFLFITGSNNQCLFIDKKVNEGLLIFNSKEPLELSTKIHRQNLVGIIEEITEVEWDIAMKSSCLIYSEVLREIAKWVPNPGHAMGHYNEYMYIVHIY